MATTERENRQVPIKVNSESRVALVSGARFPESGYSRSKINPLIAQTEETSPSPANSSDATTEEVPPQSLETPVDLNPNPNPLLLPIEPEEVEIINIVPLTLEESVELAKRNNRQLQITRLQLEADLATLDEAEAALLPNLNLEGNVRRTNDAFGELAVEAQQRQARRGIREIQAEIDTVENQIANPALLGIDDPDELQLEVQALQEIALPALRESLQNAQNQLRGLINYSNTTVDTAIILDYIFDFQRLANISIAKAQVSFSELEVERFEEQLRLDVSLAYYDLQQADQDVRIAEGDVKDRNRRLEGIRRQLEAALATRLDLLNAQVELDNAIQVLKRAQVRQETARRNIAQVLSLPPSVTPVAADPVEITDLWDLSLEETIVLALKNRVELEQQLAQRRNAEGQRRLALAAVQPSIRLFARYGVLRFFRDDPGRFLPRGYADGYEFGVTLNWTFFDGGAAAAGARRAEAQIGIAEQQYADDANRIRFEVEQAFFQLPAQLENVQIATIAAERAREAVRAAQLRFQAAVNTQTEVLDAQNRLIQAENNLVGAILGYNRALAQLQRAVSKVSDYSELIPEEVGEPDSLSSSNRSSKATQRY
ncbi:MAG: TolC family protein [Xenococcaceae cyanobacterium]